MLAATLGPKILDAVVAVFDFLIGRLKLSFTIMRLKFYPRSLKRDAAVPGLTEERRTHLLAAITSAELSIDRHRYEWVSPLLPGDCTFRDIVNATQPV